MLASARLSRAGEISKSARAKGKLRWAAPLRSSERKSPASWPGFQEDLSLAA
jgi:hypothetical protein